MLRFTCDCGRVLGYRPQHVGKKVRCSGCQRVLVIPDPDVADDEPIEAVSVSAADEEKRRPAISRRREEDSSYRTHDDPEEEDRPRKRRSRRDEEEDYEEEEERPRRRPRPRPRSGGFFPQLGAALYSQGGVWAMVVIAGLGIAGLVYGLRETILSSKSKAEARTVALEQLISGGVGDNAHVIVTDFVPGSNFVYRVKVRKSERFSGNTSGKPWEVVYVPLLPASQAPAPAPAPGGPPGIPGMIRPPMWQQQVNSGQIKVILLSRRAKNQNDLDTLFSQGRVQGMIINAVSSLDSEAKKMLKESYPGADFNQVLLLEEGRKPSSAGFSLLMIVGGVALIALGAGLGVLALMFRPRS